jgi:alpha-tubulin suppressor-like RCC1 family protein
MRSAAAFFLGSLACTLMAASAASLAACAGDSEETPSPLDPDSGVDSGADAELGDSGPVDARAPFDAAPPAVECAVTPCITRIVAGPTHYCAIASDGVVRCWGNPTPLGGFAKGVSSASPIVLEGLGDVVDIGASALRTCVAHADGAVDCFGFELPQPTRVPGAVGAKKLAVGEERSCSIGGSGEVFCWGDNTSTGTGDTKLNLGGETATAVAMSDRVAFALGATGSLFSWGSDATMLGRDTPLPVDLTPAHVSLAPALQVAASDQHVCAVTTDGRLFCWGHGDDGALGLGSIRSVAMPTEVLFPGPAWPAQVAVAHSHSCVRMTDGTLSCWARINEHGELGYADRAGVFIPTRVALPRPIVAVATGVRSTCVVANDGSVQCWGDNTYGQLGIGQRDAQRHYVPTTVVFP